MYMVKPGGVVYKREVSNNNDLGVLQVIWIVSFVCDDLVPPKISVSIHTTKGE